MATIFGHGLLGYTIGKGMLTKEQKALLLLGVVYTMLPDADVIGFSHGISYDSQWGHRGFTHSLFFAFTMSLMAAPFFKGIRSKAFIFLFLCMASHGLLDGMTTGGRGVAYFWPFDNGRHFLPWRPIMVSPLGAGRFFSTWGLKVLMSEAMIIGLPCVLALAIISRSNKRIKNADQESPGAGG